MSKITDKQKQFCNEYLIDLNATRAYKAVYKSCKKDETARANSSRMLTNANIQQYIKEKQNDLQQRTEITQDMVLKELAKIGFAEVTDYAEIKDSFVNIKDTSDIPKEKVGAISSIEQGNFGIKIRLNDKLKALELMGKHIGMFKEKEENKPTTETSQLYQALESEND